ncbi:hypothetical protein CH252_06795 [Rhodococcus sp. 06-1477-1B]|nr:hypothetical protein CH252_06795 [Rhodococcus sp. 06-1477-1B]
MNTLDVLWGFLLVVFWLIVVAGILYSGRLVWCYAANWVEQRQRQHRAEVERALDRKQAELRQTVLALAQALADERVAADETSERMVARAYLTTGRLP